VTIGGQSETQTTINTWSILGIGALVGLFSKYAIDKLRQVIIIIFTSKADLDADEAEEKIICDKRRLNLEIEKAKLEKELHEAKLLSDPAPKPSTPGKK
jgi:hypothetical protein